MKQTKKIQKIVSSIFTSVILFFAFSPLSRGQIFTGSDSKDKTDTQSGVDSIKGSLEGSGVTGTSDIGDLVLKYVNFTLPFLAIAAFVGFVYAGILYVTSYGNDEQVQKAKKVMIYAVIGLIVVILSYSIVNLLTQDLVQDIQSETTGGANQILQNQGQGQNMVNPSGLSPNNSVNINLPVQAPPSSVTGPGL